MKISIKLICILLVLIFSSSIALAEVKLAEAAPEFSATDSNGKSHKLSDFKGKYVVLEWLNHGCPFVRKHYDTGNMQKLQKTYTDKGVVWLSVASSAEGKEGYMTAEDANKMAIEKKSAATATLLDSEGTVGKLYEAKVTPHMYVINPEGKLIYFGAIDDNSSSRTSSVEGAKNYVAQALEQAMAGTAVSEAETKAYGCSVKYKS